MPAQPTTPPYPEAPEDTLVTTNAPCHGCEWAGYSHRHSDAEDGSRATCCDHTCETGIADSGRIDATTSHATGHDGLRSAALDGWACRACDTGDLDGSEWRHSADGITWAAILSAARAARECRPPAAPVSRGCLTASSMAADLAARYNGTERPATMLDGFPFPAVAWSTLLHYGTQHGIRTGTRDTRCGRP